MNELVAGGRGRSSPSDGFPDIFWKGVVTVHEEFDSPLTFRPQQTHALLHVGEVLGKRHDVLHSGPIAW